jgi:hypothetical protein
MMHKTESISSVYTTCSVASLLASPTAGPTGLLLGRLTGKQSYTTLDALKEVPADGSNPPQLLLKDGVYLGHMDWSADGHLVFTDLSAGLPSLKAYSAMDHRVAPLAIGAEARFSPDGKWIAYVGPLTVPDADAIFIAVAAPSGSPAAAVRNQPGPMMADICSI